MWDTGAYKAVVIISITPKSWLFLSELLCVAGAICALMLMHKAFLGGRMLLLQCCRRSGANDKRLETYALLSGTAACGRKYAIQGSKHYPNIRPWRKKDPYLMRQEKMCIRLLFLFSVFHVSITWLIKMSFWLILQTVNKARGLLLEITKMLRVQNSSTIVYTPKNNIK